MTKNDPSQGQGKYSYLRESPGYAKQILKQAQRALGRTGTDFSDLFVVGPHPDPRAEAYRKTLNVNELGVLKEISETALEVLIALEIVNQPTEQAT